MTTRDTFHTNLFQPDLPALARIGRDEMSEMTNLDDFVTVQKAAKLAGVTAEEIHDMITDGEIEDVFVSNPQTRDGRRHRAYQQRVRLSSIIRCFVPNADSQPPGVNAYKRNPRQPD